MSIFNAGKRAATLPEIQNSIKLKDLGLETYLTRKSTKNYAKWSNSELLERSGRRVMAGCSLARNISRPDQTEFTQNPLKNAKVNVNLAESSSETYLTRKSAKNYAFWCFFGLLGGFPGGPGFQGRSRQVENVPGGGGGPRNCTKQG